MAIIKFHGPQSRMSKDPAGEDVGQREAGMGRSGEANGNIVGFA